MVMNTKKTTKGLLLFVSTMQILSKEPRSRDY